jgi:sortase A
LKKKVISVLFVILFLFFIGIMDYPFIARMINEYDQSQVVVDYKNNVKSLNQDEIEEELSKAEEYNASLVDGVNKQRFPDSFETTGKGDSYYNSLLRSNDKGVMAAIEIPKIDVNLPVYHTTNEYSLDNGVGHVEGSSLPVGGADTHTCLAAHRGLPSKRLFTDLDQILTLW